MADITSIMLPADLNTQGLSAADGRQLKSYLYQLTEQLRYVLSNLDSENMSTAYNQKIRANGEKISEQYAAQVRQLLQQTRNEQTQMQAVQQGEPQAAKVLCTSDFLERTENIAVRYGRLVMVRLDGTISPTAGSLQAGKPYRVATLPQGWFGEQYPVMVSARQTNTPCRGYVTKQGEIYIIPVQSAESSVEISTIGIV